MQRAMWIRRRRNEPGRSTRRRHRR
jgi:hypothetical protein